MWIWLLNYNYTSRKPVLRTVLISRFVEIKLLLHSIHCYSSKPSSYPLTHPILPTFVVTLVTLSASHLIYHRHDPNRTPLPEQLFPNPVQGPQWALLLNVSSQLLQCWWKSTPKLVSTAEHRPIDDDWLVDWLEAP